MCIIEESMHPYGVPDLGETRYFSTRGLEAPKMRFCSANLTASESFTPPLVSHPPSEVRNPLYPPPLSPEQPPLSQQFTS